MLDSSVLNRVGIAAPGNLERMDILPDIESFACQATTLKDQHGAVAPISELLLADPGLHEAVSRLFGEGLDIWRTNFFVKRQGSGTIDWHHDRHFENGDKNIDLGNMKNHFSILIAITDLTVNEGALEYIPESHLSISGLERDVRPFHKRTLAEHFIDVPKNVEQTKALLELRKGEFALFHSGLLHRSLPFKSGSHRVSMVARLCNRNTKIPEDIMNRNVRMRFN